MNLAKYCDKGSKIAVSGRLKQDAYVDADGKSHSKIYVLSTKVEFLSSKPKSPDFADDFEDEIVDDELTDESVQMKDL
jgi:single-stranded DNA-binding protein